MLPGTGTETLNLNPQEAWPSGVFNLDGLQEADAASMGEEARDLARLVAGGVACAPGVWARLSSTDPLERLSKLVTRVTLEHECVRLRPLFSSRGASARFSRKAIPLDITDPGDIDDRCAGLIETLKSEDLAVALGAGISNVQVRIVGGMSAPAGFAASADPTRGDPDEVRVWLAGMSAEAWRIDRRSSRVSHEGARLDASLAESIADLADRAQLVLGRPVEIEWCLVKSRPAIVSVRSLHLTPSFAKGTWKRVALVAADEGTVAPLAIDALNRALSSEDGPSVEAHVRRIYARPYRQHPRDPSLGLAEPHSLIRASAQCASVAAEVTPVVAECARYERQSSARQTAMEVDLKTLSAELLMQTLRRRQKSVAEALMLLDKSRRATVSVLKALEAVVGPLPRECYPALAALSPCRQRRQINDRLKAMARKLEARGDFEVPTDAALLAEWTQLRNDLSNVRALGIDVMPREYGRSDRTLLSGLQSLPSDHRAVQRARKDALKRLRHTAGLRGAARPREALVMSLGVLVSRVARAKGGVSEGLAVALLGLRRAACEVGHRLERKAILDRPNDALYLGLAELEEAMAGEPGAYASRVRLRREDDSRWEWYSAPRRIGR